MFVRQETPFLVEFCQSSSKFDVHLHPYTCFGGHETLPLRCVDFFHSTKIPREKELHHKDSILSGTNKAMNSPPKKWSTRLLHWIDHTELVNQLSGPIHEGKTTESFSTFKPIRNSKNILLRLMRCLSLNETMMQKPKASVITLHTLKFSTPKLVVACNCI